MTCQQLAPPVAASGLMMLTAPWIRCESGLKDLTFATQPSEIALHSQPKLLRKPAGKNVEWGICLKAAMQRSKDLTDWAILQNTKPTGPLVLNAKHAAAKPLTPASGPDVNSLLSCQTPMVALKATQNATKRHPSFHEHRTSS